MFHKQYSENQVEMPLETHSEKEDGGRRKKGEGGGLHLTPVCTCNVATSQHGGLTLGTG